MQLLFVATASIVTDSIATLIIGNFYTVRFIHFEISLDTIACWTCSLKTSLLLGQAVRSRIDLSSTGGDAALRYEAANYSTRKTRYPIWLTRRTIEPSASDFNELLDVRATNTMLSLTPFDVCDTLNLLRYS